MGIVLLVAGHLLQELRRTRLRNCAQIIDKLVARHADAIVRDGKRVFRLVYLDTDTQLCIIRQQGRSSQSFESQLVGRI